jgi:hypothetical protein
MGKMFPDDKGNGVTFLVFFITLTTNPLKRRCTEGLRLVEDARHPTLTITTPSPHPTLVFEKNAM